AARRHRAARSWRPGRQRELTGGGAARASQASLAGQCEECSGQPVRARTPASSRRWRNSSTAPALRVSEYMYTGVAGRPASSKPSHPCPKGGTPTPTAARAPPLAPSMPPPAAGRRPAGAGGVVLHAAVRRHARMVLDLLAPARHRDAEVVVQRGARRRAPDVEGEDHDGRGG